MKDEIRQQAALAAQTLCEKAKLRRGDIVVVGCSTSEICGSRIGTDSQPEVAQIVFDAIYGVLNEKGIYLAAQCCEHLNRAIIIEREAAGSADPVNVVPQPKAGGSFATAAYRSFRDPVALEHIRADAGIDFANIDSSVTEESFKTSEEKAEEAPGYGEKDKALQDFKQHREMAREALEEMTDASYYLGVVFQSESQKREFLEKSGLASDGMFASGLALAESMGIDLERIEFRFPEARLDRTLVEMAMENDQEPRKGASAVGN